MKTIAEDIREIDMQREVNGFNTAFYIKAIAVSNNEETEEDNNGEFLTEFDGSNVNSVRNIAPFHTVIFPNTEKVYKSLQHFAKVCDDYFNDMADFEDGKIQTEPTKPQLPYFYLNRFEVIAPSPYFQKFTTDSDEHKAGDWILAADGDATMEGDKLKRKLFTTLRIVSVVKKDEKDNEGNDIPVENLNRKAQRTWNLGIVPNEKRDFALYYDATKQLEHEAKLNALKAEKENDDTGIDVPQRSSNKRR